MCAYETSVSPKETAHKKTPNRRRKPTNITLDPTLKAEAKKFASDKATDLAGLVTSLLVERLEAAKRWPPR